MANEVTPVSESSPSPVQDAQRVTNAIPSIPGGTAKTFSSVGALRTENPELYQMIMKGIAHTILSDMTQHARRLKELTREGSRR